MQISFTFKNLNSSEHIKSYIQDRLSRMERLMDDKGIAEVVLKAERQRRTADIRVTDHHVDVLASESHTDLQAAIDLALEKTKYQLTRTKSKLQQRRTRAQPADPWQDVA